jgi:hypothetical protein
MIIKPPSNKVIPGAIDGRQWEVAQVDGDMNGRCDLKRAVMEIPRGDSATARLVRLHELCHAKITPRKNPALVAESAGCSHNAIQWAEDCRVSYAIRLCDSCDDALSADELKEVFKQVPAGDLRTLASFYLAHFFLPVVREGILTAAVDSGRFTMADRESVNATVARLLDDSFGPFLRNGSRRSMIAKPTGFMKITVPLAQAFDMEYPPRPENPTPEQREEMETQKRVQRVTAQKGWGKLKGVEVMAMPNRIRPKRAIGRRFYDVGVVPSAVHRMTIDNQIFSTKVKVKGGTILCDASGSMHYKLSDFKRIISEAPAATIAFYAGRAGKGGIVIAARNGMAADPQHVMRHIRETLGGGNEVDAPALRWLIKQPGPHYWVSDEEVGARGMAFGKHKAGWNECNAICLAARVMRAENITELKMK